ncbi:pectin acetylesterase 8-like isoform X2 [Nicotiana tabacum]|uniref:Pectin acetylesterase 8-like isoform X2 n=1 Tax=Nicotiana tabacum TaxID=4097 RepID=A0AC58UG17_TOBAC|nr:pectin acetylesterase 3-like isoform X2 [Nicotiana tomentosiformis]
MSHLLPVILKKLTQLQPIGLHFRGARVFLAIMEDLLYKGMWKAENFFFPEYVIQHIWTPLFVINSAYDSWQINNSLVPDILQERHKCMLTKSNANSPIFQGNIY